MTTYAERPVLDAGAAPEPPQPSLGKKIVSWMTTTDHKVIGNMYMASSFVFFLIGGLLALVIRAELFEPGTQFVSDTLYNQMFTMHGLIMLLLFATPLFAGFANAIMPLQIGAPGRGLPAAEHVQLLDLPLRRSDRRGGLLHPRRCGRLRLVRLRPAVHRGLQPAGGR